MKTLKTTAFPSAGSRKGVEVLNESFDNISALPGWVQINNSVPPGNNWFQGNLDVFVAQTGAANGYIASNFLGAQSGAGSVDNWLITPTLTLSGTTLLSFVTRAASDPGFADMLEVRFSSGSGSGADGFTMLLSTIGPWRYPSRWERYSATIAVNSSGRFAFRYLGDASALSYIGLDSVKVITAVPEPSLSAMLNVGLELFALRRRAT